MMAYGDPVRIKILEEESTIILEEEYNKFASRQEIVASQYRITPAGKFTICIWFKWDKTEAAYDEVKDDPKIMG